MSPAMAPALPPAVLAAHIRDVPRSCTCAWAWRNASGRFARSRPDAACPWHGRKARRAA